MPVRQDGILRRVVDPPGLAHILKPAHNPLFVDNV
jgi:hypothetical protein